MTSRLSEWYYKEMGEVFGPMGLEQLHDQVARAARSGQVWVRHESGPWMEPAAVPQLADIDFQSTESSWVEPLPEPTFLRNWPTLLLFAVVVPSALTALNWILLEARKSQPISTTNTMLLFALFIAEVGCLGWAAGAFIRNSLISWLVFLWCIILIDVQVLLATMDSQSGPWAGGARQGTVCLLYALLAAEIGLGITGVTLAKMNVLLRLLLATLLTVVLAAVFRELNATFTFDSRGWNLALFCQSVANLVICCWLWMAGFRIQPRLALPAENTSFSAQLNKQSNDLNQVADVEPSEEYESAQFSILHLFIWTTTLALLIAIARAIDWSFVSSTSWLAQVIIGCCFAMISITAVWGSLGKGMLTQRLLILPTMVVLVGCLLAWLPNSWNRLAWRQDTEFWISWTGLEMFSLTAVLMVFRARGYRLIRRPDNMLPKLDSLFRLRALAKSAADSKAIWQDRSI